MKDLKYVCVQPDDTYYTWQVHLWLESLKNRGDSDKAIVLIFTPNYREVNKNWKQVIDLYPETEFHFYKDEHDVSQLLGIYIPVLRPYTLWRHWKEHPELSDKAIFYCDSDVLFTQHFNVDKYIDDDVCYVSDTHSYISASYFDSKIKDVLPEKLEEYKTRDILAEIGSVIGISREEAMEKDKDSGGAQYLLKNIDAAFWNKVMNDCILIRSYLQRINKEFFESEDRGFQSWCADMWAVLWNLWVKEKEVKVIDEMGFSWAPDPITKLETHPILHNAGVVSTRMGDYSCFYKGKYHAGGDPTKDEHLDVVLNDENSKPRCTWYYANELKKLSNKYNLNY
jgi:hypothetical protein